MRINGTWEFCDDGILRPILVGHVLAGDGAWLKVLFLVDTGADRTAISADVLKASGLPHVAPSHHLGGVGGVADSVVIETQLRLEDATLGPIAFKGHFAAFTELEALDMSVLGRDITNLFALIVDRPAEVVAMIRPDHRYAISGP